MTVKTQKPLSADFSKDLRRQLGISQQEVIAATGLPGYRLKQWEGRGLRLDAGDLRTLRDFYVAEAEARSMDFDTIESEFYAPRSGDQPGATPVEPMSRLGFLISPKLPPEVVDQLMADMEASDERIAEIVKTGVQSGLFGGMSAETESLIQELFGYLAANHLRFRCLQGRNIIAPTRDEAQTVGDHLAQWVQAKGVAHVAAPASETIEQE